MLGDEKNPQPLNELVQRLRLSYPRRHKKKETQAWTAEQRAWAQLEEQRVNAERERGLRPYRVGTYKDWEGDGYFLKPLYRYEETYYA
jgi:hypothetical protein